MTMKKSFVFCMIFIGVLTLSTTAFAGTRTEAILLDTLQRIVLDTLPGRSIAQAPQQPPMPPRDFDGQRPPRPGKMPPPPMSFDKDGRRMPPPPPSRDRRPPEPPRGPRPQK